MLPGELVAIADVAHEILGQHRRTARRVHVLEMRHAVIHQRAHPGAEQPVRMRRHIPGDLRRDHERDLEAGADVVLAVGRHRHVGGHHEGVVAGGGDAIDQRLDARRIAGQIGLVPGGRVCLPDVLELDQGGGAENHRHVRRRGRAREHDVAAIGAQRGGPERRDAERRGVGLAEQRRGLVAARDVVEHARNEAVFVEGAAVVAQRRIGLDGSGDEAVDHPRQAPAGRRLKIGERQVTPQAARNRGLRPLRGRERAVRACGLGWWRAAERPSWGALVAIV